MGSICTLWIYPQGLHAPPIQHVYLFLFWGGCRTIFKSQVWPWLGWGDFYCILSSRHYSFRYSNLSQAQATWLLSCLRSFRRNLSYRFCQYHPHAPIGYLSIWNSLLTWLSFRRLIFNLFLYQREARRRWNQSRCSPVWGDFWDCFYFTIIPIQCFQLLATNPFL
jgi:hypothetical protein